MTATRCSHVLLAVRDLRQAVRDYRRLGFTVDYATAERTARHAHVWFPSGPIIELLCPPRRAALYTWPIELLAGRGAGRRMVRWAREAEGFCDVAVVVDTPDLTGPLARLRAAGIPTGRRVRWTRTRPDGAKTRFQFAYPRHNRLPFLVTPYDPPQHPEVTHPNGAFALTAVHMGVRDEDRAAFDLITAGDPTFRVEPAPATAVLAVEIAGLRADPDPALTHGALVRPAVLPHGRREGG
ncbi:VOC family protein [Thermopolyspora sp. NPDC052614]|uniref:VOC family protein n=1 Tax=Thermopolyspora sp. NPDC052614 TaxID=3155682 RepID=UPI003442A05A